MIALRCLNARLDYSIAAACGCRISEIHHLACLVNTGRARLGTHLYQSPAYRPSPTHPMATVQVAKSHAQVKPPNVLVLQSFKDSTSREFGRIKDALESCLTPERYVVYPLGAEEVQQRSPWQDNCRLLLVPPAIAHAQSVLASNGTGASSSSQSDRDEEIEMCISEKISQEICSFVGKGGALLSMNTKLNGVLGLGSVNIARSQYCQNGVCNVTSKLACQTSNTLPEKFNALHISALSPSPTPLSATSSHDHASRVEELKSTSLDYSDQIETGDVISTEDVATFDPIETDVTLDWLDANTNQCNNTQVAGDHSLSKATPQDGDTNELIETELTDCDLACVRKVKFASGGKAILSSIDLFPLASQELGVKTLVWLKRSVEQRRRFLSSLLLSLGLECSEERLPELTHTYLVCSGENRSKLLSAMAPLLDSSSSIVGSEMSARLITTDFEDGTSVDGFPPPPESSELAIFTNPARWQVRNLSFDFLEYFKLLKTRDMGRSVLYTPVIASTQTLFTGNLPFCSALTQEMGVVSVAAQQTKGKGRSGNVWISPKGSMMFSMALKFLPISKLAQRMTLLQHLVAMAVVHGIKTIPGYGEVPLCIKWPNDIYYQDKVKLGGILVTCFSVGRTPSITAVIGCGVNVSNQYPTMSVNDCIVLHNSTTGSSLPPITEEQALARTLNSLEEFLNTYQESEMKKLLPLYYKYWLHSGAVVRLASQSNEEVTILGIDDYGYLRVETKRSKEVLSLQPDGNTFDIMKGLIATKIEQ